MLFNNVIYFIVVLLIFSINYPPQSPEIPLLTCVALLFLSWAGFSIYCRWEFRSLERLSHSAALVGGGLSARYHRLVARVSILAIFLFALAVYLCNIKYWLLSIHFVRSSFLLQGIGALTLFFSYLLTIWYFSYPSYESIFGPGITRRSFILSNLRLNLPILFPWLFLTLLYDIMDLLPFFASREILNTVTGQLLFFAAFLTLLMTFMPVIIRPWWGCKPFEPSNKVEQLEAFLRHSGFKCRGILSWPMFEGKMMTAGIMGLIPRYRYILITDSLLEILSAEELKAVLAHEMGHAKYRHPLFYMLFFIGFMLLSFGLFDFFFVALSMHPFFGGIVAGGDPRSANLFYLALSFPMLVCLLVYFRYIMGFFIRHFERQADLYSAVIMGTPKHTVASLEKIAYYSGRSRDLPSWHHFSIRERVDTLWQTVEDPDLVKRHTRFLVISFSIYLFCLVSLGYVLNFGPVKDRLDYRLAETIIKERLIQEPKNLVLLQNLAMVYHNTKRHAKAVETYERILQLDPNQPVALNNLAWILVTSPDKGLRDNSRGLELAKRAASLERAPYILDTLAEAYFVNGYEEEAVKTIREALALVKKNRGYYEKQLDKFMNHPCGVSRSLQ